MKPTGLLALVLALPACAAAPQHQPLPSDLQGATRDVCRFEPTHHHSPGVVLDFGEALYMLLPDVWTADGRLVPSGGATAAGPDDLCARGLSYLEQDGLPIETLPRTEAERAVEVDSEGAERIALWPISGFVHEGVGTVFYEKRLVRGYFDMDLLGVGVARVSHGGIAERLNADGELWSDGRFRWGSGAVLGDDGFAYVYGCDLADAFTRPCAVARVPAARAGERSAYEYLDGAGEWSAEPSDAAPLFDGTGSLSVRWNPHLGRYLMASAPVFSYSVQARSPTTPTGPFARPLEPAALFSRDTGAEFGLGDVQQLRSEGNRVFFLHADARHLQVVELTLP